MNMPLDLAPAETSAQVEAVARLYGEPLLELPKDLYIPPDALEVFLEAFEGPLDLLLYLIRKANLNVLDIPMAPLTAQYLGYVEAMRRHNLELAADYLLMAATLLEIKSRMLLPRPPRESGDESLDPRAELVRRLLEYEQMKMAAARIDALPRVERDHEWVSIFVAEKIVERQPEVSLHDLQLAWLKIMKKARLTQHHQVRREELSVREHMTAILRKLGDGDFVVFDTLFEPARGAASLVVSFLAVLELVKEKLVQVAQNEPFAPIYVKLADAANDA
ncbi:segregation/condensation protein A [Aromatoleum toluvorans]|uniref:Segregation and condensation protein A n=1 Tax=Aromatoleum toluvorans TaxID=92002 RepID=A0ABX1PSE0_9RHOO|nr:ScpA family protein [Aromatoleum toluvorans]NMG42363.1 segregation/condensation protein A [Aromatoleum toluvorans]